MATEYDWKGIKLLILDVDGVMTDGMIIISSDGTETKHFSALDGIGLRALQQVGVEIAIISGRESRVTTIRAEELGIKYIYQGRLRKLDAYQDLKTLLTVADSDICYIGDDDFDISLIKKAGIGVSVPNGTLSARNAAEIITERPGGAGAVREICDLILRSRGTSIESIFS